MIARNWAGNIDYRAAEYAQPTSIEQLQHLVAAADRARASGTGHSFNRIADTPGLLISTRGLTAPVQIDAAAGTATTASGARYAEVAAELDAAGWALHNLGSLPHISVAGACATSTHGSGVCNGSLATAVCGLELVRADGELVRIDESHPEFAGAVVSLGALGVVTALTLRIEPRYQVRQQAYEELPVELAAAHLPEILGAAYSVSLFSTFGCPGSIDMVWLKARDEDQLPDDLFGARAAATPRHPIPSLDPAAVTEQLGRPGPWHERLPHFRPDFTPSNGDELQSEFFLPRALAGDALLRLNAIADRVEPELQVFEMRAIAADGLWLSPFHERDSVGFHFTWRPDLPLVQPALRAVQQALGAAARPHWGKVFLDFGVDDVASAYPRLGDFRRLAARYDPDRCFVNDFLEQHVLAD